MAEDQPQVSSASESDAPASISEPTSDVVPNDVDAALAQGEAALAQVAAALAEDAAATGESAAPDSAEEIVPGGDGNPFGDEEMQIDQAAIEELLKQATFDDPLSAGSTTDALLEPGPDAEAMPPDAADFKLPNFSQVMQDAQASSVDLLRDVELNVKIELGRSRMLVEDVLKLGEGSVVELDKLAGDPVDVFVNERLVARGEVLVLNDNFCVRINEIVAGVKEEGL